MEINDSPVNVNVKYEKEVRFYLGVSLVQLDNGEVEGRRIPCFEYTEHTILAHKIGFGSMMTLLGISRT